MKHFLSVHWFKLSLITIVFIGILSSAFLYSKHDQNNQLLLQKQLELQERELQLKQDTQLVKQQNEEKESALKEAAAISQQNTQARINSCIISAQNERDRRKGNMSYVWTQCLLDKLGTEYCDGMKKDADNDVDKMYDGWEANCKRGIDNGF